MLNASVRCPTSLTAAYEVVREFIKVSGLTLAGEEKTSFSGKSSTHSTLSV